MIFINKKSFVNALIKSKAEIKKFYEKEYLGKVKCFELREESFEKHRRMQLEFDEHRNKQLNKTICKQRAIIQELYEQIDFLQKLKVKK